MVDISVKGMIRLEKGIDMDKGKDIKIPILQVSPIEGMIRLGKGIDWIKERI